MAVTDYAVTGGTGGPRANITGASWDVSVSANTSASTTARIDMGGFAFGSVHVPNGSSITSITWYAAPDKDTTGVAAKDEDGVALSQTVAADEVHQIPSALAGMHFVLPVTDAAGTLTFCFAR